MSRKFIAAILGLSLSLTTISANSARAADAEDIAKLLAGAATIYVIAKAAEQNKKSQSSKAKKEPVYTRAWSLRDKKLMNKRNRPFLPARCVLLPNRGKVKGNAVFGARCLNNHYKAADKLPRKCRTKVRTSRGTRNVYEAQCLRKRGFVMNRR